MDREAFRARFKAYKEGKPVSEIYDAGLPKYVDGTSGLSPDETFVASMGPLLYRELLYQGVENPDSVYNNLITQLGYESDRGRSRVAREQHNYGGVGWNGKRYFSYKNDADFVHDYVKLMNRRYKSAILAKTLSEYAAGIKKLGYFEDTLENYSRNLIGMKSLAKAVAKHKAANPDLYKIDIQRPVSEPIINPVDNTKVVNTIPAEQTHTTWEGALDVSPYLTGKPPLILNPPTKLPSVTDHPVQYNSWFENRKSNNIKKMMDNTLSLLFNDEDSDDLLYAKDGKLPRYKIGHNVSHAKMNDDGTFTDDYTRAFDDFIITPKGLRIKSGQLYKYLEPWDDEKFMNAITVGGLNNLSPSQWARRGYDLINGNLTTDSWLNGNNGIVSNKFAKDHPYYSMLFNAVGDGLIGASTVLSARVLNQLRPQNLGKHFYYNVNPQGYDNIIKLAKGIAKTVLKGSEPDIENPIWDTPGAFKVGASEYGVPEDVFRKARIDAWRMHTNIPQKYNTFTPSKRVPGAYTADRDVARMMEPDILEDESIIKMLNRDKGVGVDFFNGSGGNVGFVNYDLGRTLNGDKLGVLVTDDIWDILPFSRIDQGKGLGSRLTERTTQKILKKILPIKSKVTLKLDDLSYNDDIEGYKKWAAQHPYEAEYIDPREVFSTKRKIKPALDLAIKIINKGTTKISDFDRWLRKTLNNKAKDFEVGSLYKGSPFRVINEFPYTRALNVNNLGQMNPGAIYSYRGGFDAKDILPTLAHDYRLKGILPVNIGDNIPSQLGYK